MVETREDPEDFGMEEEKTFLDEPAILDKFKAAALITDGKSPWWRGRGVVPLSCW